MKDLWLGFGWRKTGGINWLVRLFPLVGNIIGVLPRIEGKAK